MPRYEVWDKAKLGQRKGEAETVCYVIDTAIEASKALSKGSHTVNVYNAKKKDTANPYGIYEDVDVPNTFIVVERGDKQSSIRGFGIAGKYVAARDCKRCNNTGNDPNAYNVPCNSCKGAAYRPKV